MAVVIHPDGTRENLAPDSTTGELTLEMLQRAVGGLIESVPLADGRVMMVNEEGKLMRPQLPFNAEATAIAAIPGDAILGTVVIGTAKEMGYDDGE